jgi:hypothetical protein
MKRLGFPMPVCSLTYIPKNQKLQEKKNMNIVEGKIWNQSTTIFPV